MSDYRMLNLGEIVIEGDEYYSVSDEWTPVGAGVGARINKDNRPRRRLIEDETYTFTVKSSEKDILQKGLDLLKMITDDQKKINQIENIQLTLDNEG